MIKPVTLLLLLPLSWVACLGPALEVGDDCANDFDDDGDGRTDCDDESCAFSPLCSSCGNGNIEPTEVCELPSFGCGDGELCLQCTQCVPTNLPPVCGNLNLEEGEACELPAQGCGSQQACLLCEQCVDIPISICGNLIAAIARHRVVSFSAMIRDPGNRMIGVVLKYPNEVTALAAGAALYSIRVGELTGDEMATALPAMVVENAAGNLNRHPEAAVKFRELLQLTTPWT